MEEEISNKNMKAVIIEIIQQIESISQTRQDAQKLIGIELTKDKFELLCKDLSVKICHFCDEGLKTVNNKNLSNKKIKLKMYTNIFTERSIYEKLKYALEKKYYEFKIHNSGYSICNDNKLSLDEANAYHLVPNMTIITNTSHILYETQTLNWKKDFLEVGINVNTKKKKYNYKNYEVKYEIPQPLLIFENKYNANCIFDLKGDNVMLKTSIPPSWDLRPIYETIGIEHKICYLTDYTTWIHGTAFCFHFYNSETKKLDQITFSRNNILRIIRNVKYIHQNDNRSKDLLDKLHKVHLYKNIFDIDLAFYISILSIAYEVEYSWKNYISPMLSKIIKSSQRYF